jgi:predicted Rdx family selenoprotein
VDSTLKPGLVGQFDVIADGTTIFSKHKEGRFPDAQEILDALGRR